MHDDPVAREDAGSITFRILVAPRASRPRVGPCVGGHVKVAVSAPPVDGAANASVLDLLAETFGLRRGDVTLVSGQHSKRKVVRAMGLSRARLVEVLSNLRA